MNPESPPLRPVVFITGASSGIGAAAVPLFAQAGYSVVLAARRKERLEQLARETEQKHPGTQCVPVVCDVNSDESVAAAFAAITERLGRLDVLVNNAGFGVYGSVEETPIEKFRANMETNFFGALRCTKAALPLLRNAAKNPLLARAGRCHAHIVMVSSFIGKRGIPLLSSYCASKFALEALAECLRTELHDEHIAVSVINPGVTKTEFFSSADGERPAGFVSEAEGMSAEAVAQTILQAVRHPRRNRYLTAKGQIGMFMQWLSPKVMDRAMLRAFRASRPH